MRCVLSFDVLLLHDSLSNLTALHLVQVLYGRPLWDGFLQRL